MRASQIKRIRRAEKMFIKFREMQKFKSKKMRSLKTLSQNTGLSYDTVRKYSSDFRWSERVMKYSASKKKSINPEMCRAVLKSVSDMDPEDFLQGMNWNELFDGLTNEQAAEMIKKSFS